MKTTTKTYKCKVIDTYDDVGFGTAPTVEIVDHDLKIGSYVEVTITGKFNG